MNSPMICQIVVDAALKEVRQSFNQIYLYHYMDDVLLAAETQHVLLTAFAKLESSLKIFGYRQPQKRCRQSSPGSIWDAERAGGCHC